MKPDEANGKRRAGVSRSPGRAAFDGHSSSSPSFVSAGPAWEMAAEDERYSEAVAADFPALNGPVWQGPAPSAEDFPATRGSMAYVTLRKEQVKRDLWKAVTDGNVEDLRVLQWLPVVTIAAIGTNSRTGWTIVL